MLKTNVQIKNAGRCDICGLTKRGIRVVFAQISDSRGDDEKIGKCCKGCRRAFAEKHNLEYVS
ncbi:MAG: hypothetical protein Q7R44_00150 [bacterium]|nr:hypothetical protein [bacterium]